MKIGIDIRTLMGTQYSGVPEHTLNLVREIIRLDSNNEYQFFYNSISDVRKRIPKFDNSNVKIIKWSYPNKILNYLFFKFLNWPKIDKYLGVDLFFMPHINFVALSGKSKSLLIIHDLSFLKNPEFFSFKNNLWHRMINVKKLIKRVDKIVAVSENTKIDIINLCGVDEEKIDVIYPGINNDYKVVEDSQKLKKAKEKYNLPEKFILFLGTQEPRKNVEGVIEAYNVFRENNKNLNDYRLVIAGGKGWKGKKIFSSWEASKYKDDIRFLGYVDSEDKSGLYNLASVFVYPSFYEGFGFPPLEAMACGTPTITSFSSSLGEVSGGASLQVDPYNITDISMAIEQILTDKNLREDFVQKGIEHVKKFNWEKTAKRYLELFRQL